jgi:hypothetical protein
VGQLLADPPAGLSAEELRAALEDPRLQSAAIYRVLRRLGVAIGEQPIQRHRRGECRCAR